LIHVVETVGALVYGENIEDHETSVMKNYWKNSVLSEKGFKVAIQLGLVSR
jgi:manganese transport protein